MFLRFELNLISAVISLTSSDGADTSSANNQTAGIFRPQMAL